jgi:hypothetical protein
MLKMQLEIVRLVKLSVSGLVEWTFAARALTSCPELTLSVSTPCTTADLSARALPSRRYWGVPAQRVEG